MMRHADIWRALDRLAEINGLSPSALARKAGLDATAFNRGKRVTRDGRPRWPSTESVAKALQATGTSLDTFVELVTDGPGTTSLRTVPLIGLVQAGASGYFDDAGYPCGGGWDQIHFPGVEDARAYAVEVSGDSMEPAFRDGDRLIVSPQSPIRKGDRIVVKTREGEVMVKELARQTATKIELRSLNPKHPDRTLSPEDIQWMARVLWASQ